MLNFIIWDASPEIFSIGSLTIRWYGLLFALGFLIGQQILIRIYKSEGKSEKHVETLTIYMVIATIIGARLGHCLFYEPDYFLKHPIEILYIWQGGLASHGATIGILIAIYLYSKKQTNQSYFYVLDRLVITIALAGCLIRLGNLMNSEIVGRPTDFPGGFIFARTVEESLINQYQDLVSDIEFSTNGKDSVDAQGRKLAGLDMSMYVTGQGVSEKNVDNFVQNHLRETISNAPEYLEHIVLPEGPIPNQIKSGSNGSEIIISMYGVPRHASQLYESVSCLLLFLLLYYLYSRTREKTPEGRIFGLFVVILFSLRFLYEFFKEPQVAFEQDMTFNMGQILSIPMIVAGFFILLRTYRKKNEIS